MNTEQLLQAILDELRSRNRPATTLGFGHPPKPRYIYANRQYIDPPRSKDAGLEWMGWAPMRIACDGHTVQIRAVWYAEKARTILPIVKRAIEDGQR